MDKHCDQCMEQHDGACVRDPALAKIEVIKWMTFYGEYGGSRAQRFGLKEITRWKEIHFSCMWPREMMALGLSVAPYEQEARAAFLSAFDQGMERQRLEDLEDEARETESRRKELRRKIDVMFSDLRPQARSLLDMGIKPEMLHPSEDGNSIVAKVPVIPEPAPTTLRYERKYKDDEFIRVVWEQA